MISGEYVVLDGATALALPTKVGQSLEIKEIQEPVIKWKSLDHEGNTWFEDSFQISELTIPLHPQKEFRNEVLKMLFLTLLSAANRNPAILSGNGYEITSKTEFPSNWGLGTSSTLISNISKWFKVDAFELLKDTFDGSGYDVAVALKATPITYEKKGPENSIFKTSFDPPFSDNIFFIHLNQKQNSRDSIKHYREQEKKALETAVEKISGITHSLIACTEPSEFELLLEVHENIISQLVGLQKVKTRLFPDYPGAIKSLGGWGGDFIMVTGSKADMEYFSKKGYSTIFSYSEMILR